jgi:hypothetical protein
MQVVMENVSQPKPERIKKSHSIKVHENPLGSRGIMCEQTDGHKERHAV